MSDSSASPTRAAQQPLPGPFRAGYVALLGRPNVGKSTLLNALLGFKLSIVTPKPQTTRHTILGVVHGPDYQAAFLDTPGMMRRPMHHLDRRMLQAIQRALDDANLLVLVVEPRPPGDIEERLLAEVRGRGLPALLVVNKVDTVTKPKLLPVLEEYQRRYPFEEMVPISALRRDGLDLLQSLIARHLPAGEPLFPSDAMTDRTERFLVGEIIREKVFRLYQEEVPYATTVSVEAFVERSPEHGGKDYISAVVYAERPTQRRILIGNQGEALKQVGVDARAEIERLLDRPVHLELWVKSHPRWRRNPSFLQEMGY